MDRGDCLWPAMYRGDLPVRTPVRGPVRSRIHFFWEFPVRGCVPAIICRDGCTPYQSCDGCRRRCVFRSMRARQPQLTGRRILEVAPYGYNLYPNPHESTAFPHATGVDPVAVCDRPCARSDPVVG